MRSRGAVVVSVAFPAAPASRPSDLYSITDGRGSSWRAHSRNSLADDGVQASAIDELPVAVDHSERAASSLSATTSDGANDGDRLAYGRKRTAPGKGSSGSGGNRSAGFQPRAFTAQISGCNSVQDLELLFEYGRNHDLNAIHIASFWTKLAKLVSAPAGAADPRSNSSSSRSPHASAVDPAALASFVSALEAATTPQQLQAMEARGLANVVWASAKLKPASPLAHSQGLEAAAEAAAEARAAAEAEAEPSTSQSDADRPRPARVRGGYKAAAAKAAKAAGAAAAARSGRGGAGVSDALLEAWAAAAGSKLGSFSMIDISNTTWALGRLGFLPDRMFMTKLSVATLKELPRADRPQQLSNVLLGLALLRHSPEVKDWWGAMWKAMDGLVVAESRQPDVQAVTNSLWALGVLVEACGDMPEVDTRLVSKAVFRVVQWGDRLTPAQLQDALTALPRLGFQPTDFQADKVLGLCNRLLPASDAQALSNLLGALGRMGVRPPLGFMSAYYRAFRTRLPAAAPEAAARLLFFVGTLRLKAPKWTPEIWSKLLAEAGRLRPTDVAFAALGIKRLYFSPSADAEDEAEEAGAVEAGAGAESQPDEEAAEGGRRRMAPKPRPPPVELLRALRASWDAAGAEAQLAVTFEIRAEAQEFLGQYGPEEEEEGAEAEEGQAAVEQPAEAATA
ncbi:hypothetical protein HYH03_006072 [Edaphochlamys debaryana]|uniref:Uncharacterized protein n=1 Tax=Edaphochlamys debaryana TaxID=47281 RepID=A0A835Y6W0_9CHLO|nr:hypothetical protein HYH03_006072 [Edaphochlamys debaryana]|eukprot:KAG2495833.1 hypothetical protein HYH03_006072 [Edaphochlamys debaryana]